ncbi:U32 family peptidase, partial [bacterium]|nr:U32 family peptidase [bacterium]
MIKKDKKIELLAPAKDKITAIAAINAGADAIYIGYKKFGARKSAGNSIEDIKDIVDYADKFRVNVYVTLNTIYTDEEIVFVIKLINELYEIGVSAIIIQDMGILEYKLPPIRIFASTQCHNNTLEKIKFLEETGFDRVIVPREFSLEYIKNITNNTNIDIETFIHGALCISYSGQCYLSYCNGGRSANRGECAQPCRKKYSLLSSNGDIIEKDKYLLSLKDLNLSDSIEDLILSGVTSFKIEGRLKDSCYVTNIVAFYRQEIDKILDKYNISRTSQGKSFVDFEPNPYKSFNRDFTNFNIDGKRKDICTKHYVKSIGEYIGVVEKVENKFFTLKKGKKLNNGDGICFFNEITGELQGTLVQKSEYNRIFPQNIKDIKKNIKI